MKFTQLLIITLSLICAGSLNAQTEQLQKANLEFSNGGYADAADLYKVAYKKEKEIDTKAMILFKTARL